MNAIGSKTALRRLERAVAVMEQGGNAHARAASAAEVTAWASVLAVTERAAAPSAAEPAPARIPLTDEMLQAAIDAYESSPEEDYDDVRAALLATGVFEEVPGE